MRPAAGGTQREVRNVLMVAFLYPPGAGSSGVLRPLKFSRFLPQHGWMPHVLTVREDLHGIKDPSLVREIPPEAVVHRTWALDSGRHLAVRGRHLGLLSVPDPYVSWLPFGIARGLRVARRTPIHAIYSTSPPATTHLIAAGLSRLIGAPWIADFRDPWIEEGIHPRPGGLRWRVESALERWVTRQASLIAVTTPYLRDDFLRRCPDLDPEKFRVIYNGYDEDDFQGLEADPRGECFEIIHAGLVTPAFRDPRPVLKALAQLIADGHVARAHARVTFLGPSGWLRRPEFTGSVREMGLEGIVQATPFVPHREALRRQARAAVLLLMQASDDTRSLIPAKAFEYLRLGRPVLALVNGGATADLLKDLDQCHVVHPDDGEGIRATLARLYNTWRESPHAPRTPRDVQQYERRRLTAALAMALDELTARTGLTAGS